MTRFLAVLLTLIGVALVALAVFRPAISVQTLCGCEFDAMLGRKELMVPIAACCAGGVSIIAAALLGRRHRFGELGAAVAFAVLALVPWPYELHPPRSTIATSSVIWTAVFGGLCVATFAFHRKRASSPNNRWRRCRLVCRQRKRRWFWPCKW
jgi:drug/metabolite transporter (DMT)-like permease